MDLLINKYPIHFIDEQFQHVLNKFHISEVLNTNNFQQLRQQIINHSFEPKVPIDYGQTIFVHFTYCSNMRSFPKKFHQLWTEFFGKSPINDISPILGTRNCENLLQQLSHTR
ncbi:unnamed protein product [Adineta ricciae]|uniref:Uncharacterized protein n=1 Tax=Adineta ricciae TaxID=249248 RepID=A0A816CST9_ADIRI|nr:unnamed protein product [Adineta ricciae]CAF1626471.1 unnamed protein product [Adineta ricciae]